MIGHLTLPSNIPGLLRAGCSVWNERDGLHGTVIEAESGELLVWCPTEGDGHVHSLDGSWALDLRDDLTVDCVLRWLGRHLNVDGGSLTAPRWVRVTGCAPIAWVLAGEDWCPPYVDGGEYTDSAHGQWFVAVDNETPAGPDEIPILAFDLVPLDHHDADRLALQIVVLHVVIVLRIAEMCR